MSEMLFESGGRIVFCPIQFEHSMIRVFRNAAWNVAGTVLPMMAGLFSISMLLSGLGAARLGVFSLALGLVGFSGIFDLGLSRALTQTVAQEIGKGNSLASIAELVRKALVVVFVLGLFWGALLYLFAGWIVLGLLKINGGLAEEAVIGIHWLALTLPVALVASGVIGVLEGLQRFRQLNLIRVPLGVATFMVPAFVGLGTGDLGITIGSLGLVRLCALAAWLLCLMNEFPLFVRNPGPPLDSGRMWRFTGWLSVTNIVGPLMVHADRFYLATVFSPAMVAYYTVPLDTLFRATTLPSAAMNVVFPAVAHQGARSSQAANMVRGAGLLMGLLWFLPLYLAGLYLQPLLTLWLGAVFAGQIIEITQWLLLGMLVNGFAHIPYALLQGAGRADITAKIHVLELPIYAALFVGLVNEFGVVGAAIAWCLRVFVDTVMLYALAMQLINELTRPLSAVLGLAVGGVLVSWLAFRSDELLLRLALPVVLLSLFAAWIRYCLPPLHRIQECDSL